MNQLPPYRMIYSNRKTIAIQITGDGQVVVRCPRRLGAEAAARFVEEKADWIIRHLQSRSVQPRQSKLTASELEELRRRSVPVFAQRTAYYAKRMGVDYGRITVRHQKTRWGSCSGKGNLNFNCLLLLTPPEILDYVVVHELSHRKQMNHSEKFWAEVERILPDYRQRRSWLKTQGSQLIGRLPEK